MGGPIEKLLLSGGGASIDLGITGARVGEVATVAAVDADGKPTAWGATPDIGILDGYYAGTNLTVKFAAEIAAAPYNGDPWAWIKARIQAENFAGLHPGDYIPFKTTGNVTLNAEIAGINCYKGYGDDGHVVGNHIDFICRELWPTLKPVNPVNFNNGLIPTENITADGEATSYTLTEAMYSIDTINSGNTSAPAFTYDPATKTITFSSAPAAGTWTVTGTGSKSPWLASDLYLYLNSKAGHVPNGMGFNPALKQVDYTAGGVYAQLPAALKAVVVEKRFRTPTRWSATALASSDNDGLWADIGKLWLPTEIEVYGFPCWADTTYAKYGSMGQYPLFMGNSKRCKKRSGSRYAWWLLPSSAGNTTYWCIVSSAGYANYANASSTALGAPVCFRVA